MIKSKKKSKQSLTEKYGRSGLFVPAGLLLGMGVGFITGHLLGGLFVGLGLGFLALTLVKLK